MAIEEFYELPIKPIYRQTSQNAPIELGEHALSVPIEIGRKVDVSAIASIQFDPEPRLVFKTQVGNDNSIRLMQSDMKRRVHLPHFNTDLDVLIGIRDGFTWLTPTFSVVQIHPPAANIKSVVFHLFNWPRFIGADSFWLRRDLPQRCSKQIGRVVLRAAGWRIVIQGLEETSDVVDALKYTNAYQITHTGMVEKEDGSLFDTISVETLLNRLGLFFEFVLGKPSDPSLAVGIDAQGNRVLERIGLANVESGAWNRESWFNEWLTGALGSVFTGFIALCDRTPWWEKQLTYAIYWYRHANMANKGIGTDSAIIFSQAALEMLSYYVCREDSDLLPSDKRVSKSTYDKYNASEKMRTLAEGMGIPTQIPVELTALRASPAQWVDGMRAIADLRNDLTHPRVDRDASIDASYDAWRLSMWYLDLVLLKLCGYNGKYRSRITDKIETVPWV